MCAVSALVLYRCTIRTRREIQWLPRIEDKALAELRKILSQVLLYVENIFVFTLVTLKKTDQKAKYNLVLI